MMMMMMMRLTQWVRFIFSRCIYLQFFGIVLTLRPDNGDEVFEVEFTLQPVDGDDDDDDGDTIQHRILRLISGE